MLNRSEEKRRYFNRYWETRDLPSADARSLQRAELVRSLLDLPGQGRVIDIGCGRGAVMKHLVQNGYDVCGCDLATETVSALQSQGYDVFIYDIEADSLPERYDGLLCLEVLQQVFDPEAALDKFAFSVKSGGYLIISVPNEFHIVSRLRLLFGRSHLGHFDESHIRLFTPGRAAQLFERVGLRTEQVASVSLIPPRFRFFSWIGKFLVNLWPGLFSLSRIYKLRVQ